MQIEALKTFCDVIRLKSFSRGAAENHVSQSAASLVVHQLESRLGVALIDRSQRPWKLTPEGKVYYEECRQVLERYFELEARVKNLHGEIGSVVRVASIYSVGLGPMNHHIEKFSQIHPGTRVEIDYLHPDRVYERVLADEVDFGIVSFPQARRELSIVPWCQEPMVIACHPNHPLARLKAAKLSQLSGEKFVGLDKGIVVRREVDRFLRLHGVEFETVLEFDNIEAIKNAVEVGSGIAILPKPTFEREVRTGTLAAVPFRPNGLSRPLGIIHRKGKKFHDNVTRFIALLKNGKKEGEHESRPAA